jgi:hypothetical protein
MTNLIARLEAAREGSRELDAMIWTAVNGKGQPMRRVGPPTYNPERLFCNPDPDMNWIGYDLLNIAPHYTTWLDAALTLRPEGAEIALTDLYKVPMAEVGLNFTEGPETARLEHGTLALALCIASLRARMK